MDELKNLKVIYIEDNENTRLGIERFLKRRFGKVFLAENAEKALEMFDEFSPDIAVVDLILPGMSGLEMIKKLREDGSKCKFLITSSVSDASTILEAVDLDIENYIVKHIDTAVFEEKLRRIGKSIIEQKNKSASVYRFEFENKNEVEENIRKLFIKLLKEKSGRGPRDAVVFISENMIEITAYGITGPMEKTLLCNIRNTAYVEEGRRLLYSGMERDLTKMIRTVTGALMELQNVKVDAGRDRETARFLISDSI